MWDVATRKCTANLLGHSGLVAAVAFSPDGKLLVSGAGDQTVKVWDAVTAKEAVALRGHTGCISCLGFAADGKTLATESVETKLWDVSTWKEERCPISGQPPQALVFSPEGMKLAVSSGGGTFTTIQVWDLGG